MDAAAAANGEAERPAWPVNPSSRAPTGRATSASARRRKRKISRRLATTADILDAARWRLRAWPAARIKAGVALVAGLVARGAAIEEDEPAAADVLDSVADGRDPWGAMCALAILHAEAVGDVDLLYQAGFEVMVAHQQARRASTRHHGDDLDVLILANITEMPDVTPVDLWQAFTEQAGDDCDGTIAEFNAATDTLSYAPRPGAMLRDIQFVTFRRRVQRLKKYLSQGVRQCRLPSHLPCFNDKSTPPRLTVAA